MGGGNTYALLQRLRRSGLLAAIRARVTAACPTSGASAGSNVAGPPSSPRMTGTWSPSIASTRSGWWRFNINPHYKEADPRWPPFSETRDDRIREYHVVNTNPVLGLEEGSWVIVEDGVVTACGTARVKLFRRGTDPVWLERRPTPTPRLRLYPGQPFRCVCRAPRVPLQAPAQPVQPVLGGGSEGAGRGPLRQKAALDWPVPMAYTTNRWQWGVNGVRGEAVNIGQRQGETP